MEVVLLVLITTACDYAESCRPRLPLGRVQGSQRYSCSSARFNIDVRRLRVVVCCKLAGAVGFTHAHSSLARRPGSSIRPPRRVATLKGSRRPGAAPLTLSPGRTTAVT